MQDIKVITPYDLDNSTVRLNSAGKVEAVLSFSGIPEKPFVVGSKVLAVDPSGILYQFGQNSDYFKDGALELYLTNSELLSTGETRHSLRVTVTNATDVAIPKATVILKSANTISDFVLDSSSAESVTFSGSEIIITSLPAYGRVVVNVYTTSDYSSYVSATLSIEGDVVTTNNYATINLQRKVAPPESTNVYTQDCPLVTATFDNWQLSQSPQVPLVTTSVSYNSFNTPCFYNMIDQPVLNGATFVFSGGASSVRVFIPQYTQRHNGRFNGIAFVKELERNKYRSWMFDSDTYVEATSDSYTFTDGTLVFTTDTTSAVVYVRTGNESCKWQTYVIGTLNADTTLTFNDNRIEVTGLNQQYYRYVVNGAAYGGDKFNDLPLVESSEYVNTNLTDVRYFTSDRYWESQDQYKYYMTDTSIDVSSKLVIEIPAGTEASFKVEKSDVLPNQQGAVRTDSTGNVVVSASAMPTDSVYTSEVDIIIKQ